jgi:hypothetical protein
MARIPEAPRTLRVALALKGAGARGGRLVIVLAVLIGAVALVAGGDAAVGELFDGKDLSGWELLSPDKTATLATVARVTPEGVLSLTGKPIGYLATTRSFKDYRLRVEYRWAEGASPTSNGGVLVHIASGPIDRDTWPLCLQIQTKRSRVGDLLPMAGAAFAEALTSAPGKTPQLDRRQADSEKPLGEWNTIEVVCRGDAIEVSVNGVAQNRVTRSRPAEGRIGLQLEGAPFDIRRVTLTPLE